MSDERDGQRQRQPEEQVLRAQSVNAYRAFADGVAHASHMLSVSVFYTSAILRGLEQDHPLRSDIVEVQKAGVRAAELARQLIAFGREQRPAAAVIDIDQVVAGLERMLRRLLGDGCALMISSAGLVEARADEAQVERVLLNLVMNARDAMPDGGLVLIETAVVAFGEDCAAKHAGVVPGRYAMLGVTDTGVGMDTATQERIVEPFFTTKELGKGTGLGLPSVCGIVEKAGGHVFMRSEPGKGTTFKVYLPTTCPPTDNARPEPPPRR